MRTSSHLDVEAFASNSEPMYRIIGSDGKEYGPVSAQQLREWISQGRVNAETKVLVEGSSDWRPLSEFPEFMVGAAPAAPTMQGAIPPAAANMLSAASQVSGPATALIVTAVIGALYQVGTLLMHFLGMGASMMQMPRGEEVPPIVMMMMSGTFAVISGIIALVFSALVLVGALKMKKLESYGLAMAASIVAAVPCVSPCCLLGLPIGIWALVVLSKPEVKAAFNQNA